MIVHNIASFNAEEISYLLITSHFFININYFKLFSFFLKNLVGATAGLLRCGKSCRLRWTNYLRPDVKRGLLSDYEEKMVIDLHAQLGNRFVISSNQFLL